MSTNQGSGTKVAVSSVQPRWICGFQLTPVSVVQLSNIKPSLPTTGPWQCLVTYSLLSNETPDLRVFSAQAHQRTRPVERRKGLNGQPISSPSPVWRKSGAELLNYVGTWGHYMTPPLAEFARSAQVRRKRVPLVRGINYEFCWIGSET